jgi:D-alanine-D-alanine ligase
MIPCDSNLQKIKEQLVATGPDCVFNLVESLDGAGRLIHLVPSLLETMAVLFTGSSAESLYLTSNKILAKNILRQKNLLTPVWVGPYPASAGFEPAEESPDKSGPWIIKSLWEHASLGIDHTSVIHETDAASLLAELEQRAPKLGGACFAEAYIEGREFNLSILAGPTGPEVLAPAEIHFENYDDSNRLKIVDYSAKWANDSFEYTHTPRKFEFNHSDEALIQDLRRIAIRCWNVFNLRGYARVDFRVDAENRPFILEINTNPCIAPDAGFAAAIDQAGISYDDAITRILSDTLPASSPLKSTGKRILSTSPAIESFLSELTLRDVPGPDDPTQIRSLTEATGFFYQTEMDVAEELVLERLSKGEKSGYFFIFAEHEGQLAGYTCYGPIAGTTHSYDLFWIAVHPDFQNRGMGTFLLTKTHQQIQRAGGKRVYAETSSRFQYASTRLFYEKNGYRCDAIITDFYGLGDDKVVYCFLL